MASLQEASFLRLHAFKGSYMQKPNGVGMARSCSSAGAHDEDAIKICESSIIFPPAVMESFTKSWLRKTFNKESMSSEERAALHMAKMKEFQGGRVNFCNPIFERLWAPWAESVQYIDAYDPRARFDPQLTSTLHRKIAIENFSYAIPTFPVLRYMVCKAPDGKIVEIGSGFGYWVMLLQILGADVVAVDDFSEMAGKRKPMVKTVQMDGAQFIKEGGADGRALFLCWPRMKPWTADDTDQPSSKECFCLGEACLDLYKGNTVFFVGENGGCTYDVAGWMETHQEMGWRLETEMQIPCWRGIHDSFMCFVKHEES